MVNVSSVSSNKISGVKTSVVKNDKQLSLPQGDTNISGKLKNQLIALAVLGMSMVGATSCSDIDEPIDPNFHPEKYQPCVVSGGSNAELLIDNMELIDKN